MSNEVSIKIQKINPNTGKPDLLSTWDGNTAGAGATAPTASDISAVSGVGKGSTTNLAGAASYQTATQVPPANANFFVASVFADQAGTLFVEKLVGGTWYPVNGTAGTATVAGATTVSKVSITTASGYRARFVNGATPTTSLAITTNFTSA